MPSSECDAIESCRAECDEGWVNACTRLADLTYGDQSDLAEEMWLESCESRDAAACARLMQLNAAAPNVADGYGWKACVYGDVMACEYLGEARLVRALDPAENANADVLFRDALRAYRRACRQQSWFGCVRAAETLRHLEDGPSEEAERESHRAIGMARASCDDAEAGACRFLAEYAHRTGNQDLRRDAYGKGCRALLASALPDHEESIEDQPMCRRAEELGLTVAAPEPGDARPTAWAAGRSHTEAKRISGESEIAPPDAVKVVLQEQGISRLDARLRLCLSKLGMVAGLRFFEPSRSAVWNGRILRAMREWRYSPFTVEGQPAPVCTEIAFIYEQS